MYAPLSYVPCAIVSAHSRVTDGQIPDDGLIPRRATMVLDRVSPRAGHIARTPCAVASSKPRAMEGAPADKQLQGLHSYQRDGTFHRIRFSCRKQWFTRRWMHRLFMVLSPFQPYARVCKTSLGLVCPLVSWRSERWQSWQC